MSTPWSWSGGGRRQVDEVGWSQKVTEMGWGTDRDEKGKKGGHTMTTCNCCKSFPTQKVGKLMPNQIPSCHWEVISVDTIRELPESKGYNAILVVVDRLSKCIHAVPTVTMIDSAGVAHLFLEHVWRHHRLPEAVISDRGSAFVSNFSRELAAL